ncbi:hypothetical protein [Streptomyces sp. WAC05374]|uniref:hypothetical protein n=1 Tax=Streptomyces sp. WAC05374 TaxID=2487420 RepID=UPI001359CC0F|nr:hypothetical protein [Streptomyces sp. WAC05374]
MTIKVYRVTPDGARRTIRDEQEVAPTTTTPATGGYSPCSCPRCRPAETRPC